MRLTLFGTGPVRRVPYVGSVASMSSVFEDVCRSGLAWLDRSLSHLVPSLCCPLGRPAHTLHTVRSGAVKSLTIKGVGVETAAQLLFTCGDNPDRLCSEATFASLCGVSPVPASSGRTARHRLNRGGDRQANRAPYTIAVSRMAHDTRTYAARRTH